MKRTFAILLVCGLLLGLLPGCREGAPSEPSQEPSASGLPSESADSSLSAVDLASAAFDRCGREDQEGLEGLYAQENREELEIYAQNAYKIEAAWEDMAVIRATGASAFEIAVVRMEDDSAAVRAATAFMNYISTRQGDFAGYAPDEANMAASGEIFQNGPFAALFICPDPMGASAAAEAVLNGECPLEPEAGGPGDETPGMQTSGVKALRDLLVSIQGVAEEGLEKLDDGDLDRLNAYVKDSYGLAPDQWEECAIARDEGSAFEIAVVRVSGGWDIILAVNDCLTAYLDGREAQFDPATEQGRLLHGAIVGESMDGANCYVVLLACEDRSGAMTAFYEAAGTMGFSYSPRYRYLDTDPNYPERCLFTPPNQDDMSIYDTADIRAAWEEGDPSGLSGYDREIYQAAKEVLDDALKDGMSDYEKELALYSWMVKNVGYDWTHQDRMEETPRESFTPYGGLVKRKAICLGFATTFQLLMDLAGVECATVVGASHNSRSDHAWNMVRLNGEWYCVDVTWDANAWEQGVGGEAEEWDYFNVTSDDMADSDHQWDYANTPEATAEDRGKG